MADQKPKIIALIPKKVQIVQVHEANEGTFKSDPQDDVMLMRNTPKLDVQQRCYDQRYDDQEAEVTMMERQQQENNNDDFDTYYDNDTECKCSDRCSDRQDENSANNNNLSAGVVYIERDINRSTSETSETRGDQVRHHRVQEERERRVNSLRDELEYKRGEENDEFLVGRIRDISTITRKMATLAPKSPKPISKTDKEESIWDKLGTLGRKKRIKEVQDVQEEGKYAIDSPGSPTIHNIGPEDYDLEENEERSMLQPGANENPKFLQLNKVLIEWINDELASQRIIVQDLAEDLYDGQVLQKLLEKLTGDKLDSREVTQSEKGQREKLDAVLSHFNYVLGLHRTGSKKWNVEAIHSKNIVSIMHLLVALARHFRPPVRLTEHVSVPVVVVKKTNGILTHHIINETITTAYDDVGMRCERDAFDTLFDHAPDKLLVVKKSLVTFVNKHLNKINLEVTELETQFHDGVYLTLLMGLLEGFFVPLHSFHLTPKDFEQKVHNVMFAFELMEEVGFMKLKARPEDIVNQDLKSTLRVLYNLFLKYRHL